MNGKTFFRRTRYISAIVAICAISSAHGASAESNDIGYSRTQLNDLTGQIASLVDSGDPVADKISSWYIDETANRVRVGVSDQAAQKLALFKGRQAGMVDFFPQEPISLANKRIPLSEVKKVVKVESASAASGVQQAPYPSRLLDAAPYSAGNRTLWYDDQYLYQCTTAAHSSDLSLLWSAGHCFPTGKELLQAYYDTAEQAVYYTGILGTVRNSSFGSGSDYASITVNPNLKASPDHHVGASITANQKVFETYHSISSRAGDNVCSNGSVTGYKCNARVLATNICINVENNVRICGITSAETYDGSRLVNHGDSGGPVLINGTARGAQVTGIISAMGGNNGQTMYYVPTPGIVS